jgi:hypothetical protein
MPVLHAAEGGTVRGSVSRSRWCFSQLSLPSGAQDVADHRKTRFSELRCENCLLRNIIIAEGEHRQTVNHGLRTHPLLVTSHRNREGTANLLHFARRHMTNIALKARLFEGLHMIKING